MVALARNAMATRFEILLPGDDEIRLRAAGEEALDEIERIEAQLSLFRPTSEISRINLRAAHEPVRVSTEVFDLLRTALRLSAETDGAFDITVAALMRCWGFHGGTGRKPGADEIERAMSCVGSHLVELSETGYSVRLKKPGVMLDLGAIGKGYALDCSIEILREAGVANALIHGGTSTMFAMGRLEPGNLWKVGIEHPRHGHGIHQVLDPEHQQSTSTVPELLATVALEDEALSVSAISGKSFQDAGKTFGHVIDPRTGQPVASTALAAVVLPSATETDALSTALLTLGPAGQDRLTSLRPGMKTLLVPADNSGNCLVPETRGFAPEDLDKMRVENKATRG
jgi:thiamine biosynthesis lipoprotein